MLILAAHEVRRALSMEQAIATMKDAFAALAEGRVELPLRTQMPVRPYNGVSLVMPAFVDVNSGQALAVKVISLFPGNSQRGLPLINAAVLVLDPETGRPAGVLEGATLTALRTGAASGLATSLLARADARTVAIFGAGLQAQTQFEAVCQVRAIDSARVYDSNPARADAFLRAVSAQAWCPLDCRLARSAQEALTGADIICTATTSKDPVFADSDLGPGVHINAIGSYQPHVQEIPFETIARARVVVDLRSAALEETGDLIQPIRQKKYSPEQIHAELGELVLGRKKGRASDGEVTLFKSVGLAVQDAVAARTALANARRLGLGTNVDF